MLTWQDIENRVLHGNPPPNQRVEKTDDQWRKILPSDVHDVTRHAGTERPFSSPMCAHFEPGFYACACCDTMLFDATQKFDSGTGWPSFTQPLEPNAVAYFSDGSLSSVRIEITCSTCDAHLGHIFPDGPAPSKLRYCVNALSLKRIA
ncbi:peptide-methionine (R)-S-oxide reductase MsrB [Candidatus Methylopumilus planktonicus]|uniref:peptide-methionine (R)-S-oxide reductase MsrB n=1 Tax=Candidatus Methylopumilus planktonicus TaxID=1581557 RepID=UPI001122C4AD|nr:peptide-methionine (R)-S-oxide reductase MsrB [Candidatus Methylopumilus planktonicus]QDD06777.1 peptide-methionine (R)-S-oxide reductase MsrB [Candidatus Methylopumilus planktonicus]QDD08113.1 peptide-methionine (R)-S-oxide reductase MsrB [Candidatus Methylopumilus planktonicus]QDD09439.1 peptide-methionine (R)-S-oxide reductase MsrB [Candidatus Methylopumilus planktonicus]